MVDKAGEVYKHRTQRYRIIKEEKLLRTGRHGGSSNQEQPKRKGEDKLRKQGGSEKGDKLGTQGGYSQDPKGESSRKTGLGVIRWQQKISEISNPVIEKWEPLAI